MTLEDDLRRAGETLRATRIDAPQLASVQHGRRVRHGVGVAVTVLVVLVTSVGIALAAPNDHHHVNVSPAGPVPETTDTTSTTTSNDTSTTLLYPPTSTGTETPTTATPAVLTPGEAESLHLWNGAVTFDATSTLPIGDTTVVRATLRNLSDQPLQVFGGTERFMLDCNDGYLIKETPHDGVFFVVHGAADPNILGPRQSVTISDTITPISPNGYMRCGIAIDTSSVLPGGWGPSMFWSASDFSPSATPAMVRIPAPTTTTSPPTASTASTARTTSTTIR